VKLLRNRVRMLQIEHEKAQKKVNDTAKKTNELVQLRMQNDMRFQEVRQNLGFNSSSGFEIGLIVTLVRFKFVQKTNDRSNKQHEQRAKQELHYQQSQERRNQVKNAKLGMYMGKRAGVQSVRDKLRQDIQRKKEFE